MGVVITERMYWFLSVSDVVNMAVLVALQAVQEQVTSAVQEIGHLIEPISTAARGEAAQLGHKVNSAHTLSLLQGNHIEQYISVLLIEHSAFKFSPYQM